MGTAMGRKRWVLAGVHQHAPPAYPSGGQDYSRLPHCALVRGKGEATGRVRLRAIPAIPYTLR